MGLKEPLFLHLFFVFLKEKSLKNLTRELTDCLYTCESYHLRILKFLKLYLETSTFLRQREQREFQKDCFDYYITQWTTVDHTVDRTLDHQFLAILPYIFTVDHSGPLLFIKKKYFFLKKEKYGPLWSTVQIA